MFKFARLQVFILMLFALLACSEEGANNKKKLAEPAPIPELEQLVGARVEKNTAFVSIDNELAFMHSVGPDIIFQKGTKKTVIESGKKTERFWLHYDGKYLYALWWRKFYDGKGKHLFVSTSKDKGITFGPAKIISSEYGVLPTVRISSDPSGKVMVVYHDERNQKSLQVHANFSNDGGDTWQSHDVRVDQDALLPMTMGEKNKGRLVSSAHSPYVFLMEGHKAMVVWQQVETLDGFPSLNINSRLYDFDNASWSDVQTIYRNEEQSGIAYSVEQDKTNIVVMMSLKDSGVTAVFTTDAGKNWHEVGSNYKQSETLKDSYASYARAIITDDKILVWSTQSGISAKPRVELSTISLAEKKWEGVPRRFDRGNDPQLTTSTNLMPVKLSDGFIITAWTDYRHILPAVYVDVSKDQGKTWLKQPKVLSVPGYHPLTLVNLIAGDAKAEVISSLLDSDGKKMFGRIVHETLSFAGDGSLVSSYEPVDRIRLSPEQMKARLEERAKEFWKLRKEGKWKSTWNFFDPLYQKKFGYSSWIKTQGKLRFGDYTITNIDVENDTFGTVRGVVGVGMDTQVSKEGVLEASPPKDKEVTTKWGWFYDDWYFMPDLFFLKIHDY